MSSFLGTYQFKGAALYERIFERVLYKYMSCGFVNMSMIFIDLTHIKAAANNKKFIKAEAEKTAKFYESALEAEIDKDREEHGKSVKG